MNPISNFESLLFPSDDVSAERKLFECFAEFEKLWEVDTVEIY